MVGKNNQNPEFFSQIQSHFFCNEEVFWQLVSRFLSYIIKTCSDLPIYLLSYLFIYLLSYLPIYLLSYLPIYLPIYVSTYLLILHYDIGRSMSSRSWNFGAFASGALQLLRLPRHGIDQPRRSQAGPGPRATWRRHAKALHRDVAAMKDASFIDLGKL